MDEQLEHQIKNYLQEVRFTVTSDPFSFFFSEEARAKRQSTREETVYNAQRIQEERARNDFASVWPNVSTDGGGVMDANVPAWWEAEYRRLLARKEAAVVAVPGTGITVGRDEFGNGFIRGEHGTIQINAAQWASFVRVVLSMPMGMDMPEEGAMTTGQTSAPFIPQVKSGSTYSGSTYSDNPIIAERQKQNEERMAFAYANQARYQDDLGRQQQAERRKRLREELG